MRASSVLFPMAVGLFVAISFLICTPGAHADTIDIIFTGLDFEYENSEIFAGTANTDHNTDPAKSDAVTTVILSTESGDPSDTTVVYADLFLEGISGISDLIGSDKSSNSNSFGIDLFSTDSTPFGPWSLQLNVSDLRVIYNGLEGSVFVLGEASVHSLTLPLIDTSKKIQVSIMSSTLSGVETPGGILTAFTASDGTGTISATLVPEPSTLLGLFTGALGLAAYAWRRRKR